MPRRVLQWEGGGSGRFPCGIFRSPCGPWTVLAEGWCGDGANSIPYLARLVEALPGIEMRILFRDQNPDLMDEHLTGETRGIPVVMILDGDFREVVWWGPRPAPLQEILSLIPGPIPT